MPANLDRKFEKFLGGPIEPPEQRIHVSIDSRNVISLNAKSYSMIGKPVGAWLHFSRVDDTIAIEPVDSLMLTGVFPFRANGSGRYLNAASFCRNFGITLDTTFRFLSPEFKDGALHLKMKETIVIARRRKYQRKPKA
ncbi:MAG: hypothetical protein IPL32_16360 [Chloracidobacterium sp.]|nr:hypothetical protein [Chloracidobacterium sp.]